MKGFIKGRIEKEGKMPEKAVYALTSQGEQDREK
jgi:DNA-binding PadR family transcriptional regulator